LQSGFTFVSVALTTTVLPPVRRWRNQNVDHSSNYGQRQFFGSGHICRVGKCPQVGGLVVKGMDAMLGSSRQILRRVCPSGEGGQKQGVSIGDDLPPMSKVAQPVLMAFSMGRF
jgi:hypothetical protein